MGKDMSKDACCGGMGRWFCPNIVGVVAGLIVIVAGLSKFIAGKQMLVGVGGMALGIFGIEGHPQIALYLGGIAATIEVLGGISFAVGCRKTSGWAALGLTIVMGVALLAKLTNMSPLEGGMFSKVDALLKAVRIDLLLLAVFLHKAVKLVKKCCGMGCGSCCSMPAKK